MGAGCDAQVVYTGGVPVSTCGASYAAPVYSPVTTGYEYYAPPAVSYAPAVAPDIDRIADAVVKKLEERSKPGAGPPPAFPPPSKDRTFKVGKDGKLRDQFGFDVNGNDKNCRNWFGTFTPNC